MKQSDTPNFRRLSHGLIIAYEDSDVLVADKPEGLLSIANGAERDKTAYWILSEYLRRKGEKRRPAVVHRLDRDTSGLMLFVKSGQMKKTFMDNWNAMVKQRRYIALVEGEITEGEGTIEAPLGEDASGNIIVQKGGKPAVTHWKLLETFRGFSLLALELETGRRNQIRAHLAWLGHPVAGDRKYSAKTDPLKRLCLHAETLVFYHPGNGMFMEFESEMPRGFRRE